MESELPIACSLDAGELSTRMTEMADLGRAALVHARRSGRRAELRFAAGIGIRERVDSIVASEARCCAFLTMRVVEAGDEIVLWIDAPEGAEGVLEGLIDAFEGGAR